MSNRIKVKLYNKTFKEIDMSDFSVIPEELFANRDDIVEVELPEGVKSISANAFENCQRLEKVVFPSTLESIGEEAFVNCSSLKEADYGKNVRITPTSFTTSLTTTLSSFFSFSSSTLIRFDIPLPNPPLLFVFEPVFAGIFILLS